MISIEEDQNKLEGNNILRSFILWIYDARISDEFRIFTNVNSALLIQRIFQMIILKREKGLIV